MPVKVVDASAVGALLFGEPEADQVTGRLQNNRLVAPTLLPFEVSNICVKKARRHPAKHDALLAALRLFSQFAIELLDVDVYRVVQLAGARNLTAYDAAYLWLALKFKAELVTLDRTLNIATSISSENM